MAQKLEPIDKLNRGIGVADIKAAGVAVTDVNLTWNNTGDQMLFIRNDDAGVRVATLRATPDPFGRGVSPENDVSIAIPAGETGFFPFASPSMFNDGATANVELDAVTSATVLLVQQRKG